MRRLAITALFALVAWYACGSARSKPASETANVYYINFVAERYAGYQESEMKMVGCLYKVDVSVFRQLLESASAGNVYNSRNATAEVDLPDGETYFIDRLGNVIDHDKVKSIDKDRFDQGLTLVPTKRCR